MAYPLEGQAGMDLSSIASGSVTGLHLELDDGRKLSIEMVDEHEVAFVVRQGDGENEIVWSEVLNADLQG